MKDKNKKKLLIVLASILCIGLISLGTYAIFNTELLSGINSISSGQVKMSYTETNEIGMNNALPMKDDEGKLLTNYFDFSVLSYIKTKANDDTKRKLSYNIVLEPLSVDNPLNDNEIKVYLTMVNNGIESVVLEPTTINNLSDYILKSQEESFSNNKGEVVTNYRLRAWLDESVDMNKLNAKSYSYKFRVNVNNDTVKSNLDKSGANAPELASNMIPVYYDSASDSWKKADSNNSNGSSKWYDYDNKMWANAVTVSETNRDTYLKASAGTTISMDDINTMWVWIPRYTYTYLNTNTPEEIKIKFEKGTNSTGTIKCTDAMNQKDSDGNTISEVCTDSTNGSLIAETSTYTHPAFTFGDKELTGIWVGKFELSGAKPQTTSSTSSNDDSLTKVTPLVADIPVTECRYYDGTITEECTNFSIIVKPNVYVITINNISSFETNIMNMKNSGNKYGFTTSEDTHMMKNTEWGAVTYLSHSKYGINKEVAINSATTYTTGCGPQSEGSTSSGSTCNAYQTTLGQSASTTGNIYGIYDMSGGTFEYVMGNLVTPDGSNLSGDFSPYNSGYTGKEYNGGSFTSYTGVAYPESKYYTKYSYGTDALKYTRGKLGDATKEMAPTGASGNWYSDYANFPTDSYSWFLRGGSCGSNSNAGLFYFEGGVGRPLSNASSRPVLVR